MAILERSSWDIVVRCCALPSQMAQKQCAGSGLSQPAASSPLHFQGPGLAGCEGLSVCCFLPMVYQKKLYIGWTGQGKFLSLPYSVLQMNEGSFVLPLTLQILLHKMHHFSIDLVRVKC